MPMLTNEPNFSGSMDKPRFVITSDGLLTEYDWVFNENE